MIVNKHEDLQVMPPISKAVIKFEDASFDKPFNWGAEEREQMHMAFEESINTYPQGQHCFPCVSSGRSRLASAEPRPQSTVSEIHDGKVEISVACFRARDLGVQERRGLYNLHIGRDIHKDLQIIKTRSHEHQPALSAVEELLNQFL